MDPAFAATLRDIINAADTQAKNAAAAEVAPTPAVTSSKGARKGTRAGARRCGSVPSSGTVVNPNNNNNNNGIDSSNSNGAPFGGSDDGTLTPSEVADMIALLGLAEEAQPPTASKGAPSKKEKAKVTRSSSSNSSKASSMAKAKAQPAAVNKDADADDDFDDSSFFDAIDAEAARGTPEGLSDKAYIDSLMAAISAADAEARAAIEAAEGQTKKKTPKKNEKKAKKNAAANEDLFEEEEGAEQLVPTTPKRKKFVASPDAQHTAVLKEAISRIRSGLLAARQPSSSSSSSAAAAASTAMSHDYGNMSDADLASLLINGASDPSLAAHTSQRLLAAQLSSSPPNAHSPQSLPPFPISAHELATAGEWLIDPMRYAHPRVIHPTASRGLAVEASTTHAAIGTAIADHPLASLMGVGAPSLSSTRGGDDSSSNPKVAAAATGAGEGEAADFSQNAQQQQQHSVGVITNSSSLVKGRRFTLNVVPLCPAAQRGERPLSAEEVLRVLPEPLSTDSPTTLMVRRSVILRDDGEAMDPQLPANAAAASASTTNAAASAALQAARGKKKAVLDVFNCTVSTYSERPAALVTTSPSASSSGGGRAGAGSSASGSEAKKDDADVRLVVVRSEEANVSSTPSAESSSKTNEATASGDAPSTPSAGGITCVRGKTTPLYSFYISTQPLLIPLPDSVYKRRFPHVLGLPPRPPRTSAATATVAGGKSGVVAAARNGTASKKESRAAAKARAEKEEAEKQRSMAMDVAALFDASNDGEGSALLSAHLAAGGADNAAAAAAAAAQLALHNPYHPQLFGDGGKPSSDSSTSSTVKRSDEGYSYDEDGIPKFNEDAARTKAIDEAFAIAAALSTASATSTRAGAAQLSADTMLMALGIGPSHLGLAGTALGGSDLGISSGAAASTEGGLHVSEDDDDDAESHTTMMEDAANPSADGLGADDDDDDDADLFEIEIERFLPAGGNRVDIEGTPHTVSTAFVPHEGAPMYFAGLDRRSALQSIFTTGVYRAVSEAEAAGLIELEREGHEKKVASEKEKATETAEKKTVSDASVVAVAAADTTASSTAPDSLAVESQGTAAASVTNSGPAGTRTYSEGAPMTAEELHRFIASQQKKGE